MSSFVSGERLNILIKLVCGHKTWSKNKCAILAEITLSDKLLAVGGLEAKTTAAQRVGIKALILTKSMQNN
uniref:Lon proteolytic domain-containing protein n=1 Tax=Meloidogyne hapla TaxID=6305 RepID=A0A1I8B2I4_MELHA